MKAKNIAIKTVSFIVTTTLILGACSVDKKNWKKAKEFNSVKAYENFITKHPESEFTDSAYYLIVSVLLFSGVAKIIDPLPLIKTLEAFKLFSFTSIENEINLFIATTLPIYEIGLALLLVLKIKLNIALPLTLLLFTTFLFYSIYGYYIGITNDCGCFGDLIKSEFGVGMVVRNIVFLLIVVALFSQTKRANIK